MKESAPIHPKFLGGTLAEHVLFVVTLCRYQHHSVRLALVHYLTWSIMHVSLYAIAFALAGQAGAIVLGVVLVGWALRMDMLVGLSFGALAVGYATAAHALVSAATLTPAAMTGLSLCGMVAALLLEVGSHVALQGYPPGAPARAALEVPRHHALVFVPYFVVSYGLFFLTLDLAMRLFGYRMALHQRVSELSMKWHQLAIGEPSTEGKTRERDWHRRVITEKSQPCS